MDGWLGFNGILSTQIGVLGMDLHLVQEKEWVRHTIMNYPLHKLTKSLF